MPTRVRCIAAPVRISLLARGYASSVLHDLTPNCREANFFLAAQSGQRMVLVMSSPGAADLEVTAPDGRRVEGVVAQEGVVLNQVLPQTGDYRIRIVQRNVKSPWTGQVLLTAVLHPLPLGK